MDGRTTDDNATNAAFTTTLFKPWSFPSHHSHSLLRYIATHCVYAKAIVLRPSKCLRRSLRCVVLTHSLTVPTD